MSKKDEIEDLVHLETFNIYFHDLREDCQKELCEIFKTTPRKRKLGCISSNYYSKSS